MNSNQNPDLNPNTYEHITFGKVFTISITENGKNLHLMILENWITVSEECRDRYQSPWTKLKFKWIQDLKMNPATLNLTEQKVRSSLEWLTIGNNFLNRKPESQTLNATIRKRSGFHKQRMLWIRQKGTLGNEKISSPTSYLTEGCIPIYKSWAGDEKLTGECCL